MRSVRYALLLLAVPLALPAPADEIVLKDGRTITTRGPYKVKGKSALMTASDGTFISIAVGEIDVQKTAEAQARAAEPAPTPEPVAKVLTPAEAARVKSSRKATVVLNDADVAHPLDASEGSGEAKETTDGRVEVGTHTATPKESGGYTVTGTLVNTGENDALAVVLSVEAVGENNKTLTSGFAQVAKDTLTPGEKTTFTVELGIEPSVKATVFRFYPRWKIIARPAATGDASAEAPATEPSPSPTPTAVPKAPTPAARPTPRPPPPGYSNPPGNAPVGQPDNPGGSYLPVPADSQPKPPE